MSVIFFGFQNPFWEKNTYRADISVLLLLLAKKVGERWGHGSIKKETTERWYVAETAVEKGKATKRVRKIAHKFIVVVLLAFLHSFNLTSERTRFPENGAWIKRPTQRNRSAIIRLP